MNPLLFHILPDKFSNSPLPESFTNPFDYLPNPMCICAAQEVNKFIKDKKEWQQDLSLGKMFGVLIVQYNRQLGFLAAFSGNLRGGNECGYFVPPVYNLLDKEGFFKKEEAIITQINRDILKLEEELKNNLEIKNISNLISDFQKKLCFCKKNYSFSKKKRDELRASGNISELKNKELIKESQFQKAEIKRVEKCIIEQENLLFQKKLNFVREIETLKKKRKSLSVELQDKIFKKFIFNNALGESSNLLDIFKPTLQKYPPAGAGECAAPKLLQYAYKNNLKPIAMAEFWYGNSPKGEIRHSGKFYLACKGKCAPILGFMLKGLNVDSIAHHKEYGVCDCKLSLSILYEDKYLVVVDKPNGILSVPGKSINKPSVLELLKQKYPNAEGPMLVHRLDMHTSGVMIAAKTAMVYKELQKQFAQREIKKVYYAVLDGIVKEKNGEINLPLAPDYDNRPMQKVDFEYGKLAVTKFEVITIKENKTYIKFFPLTGRTHQLRVHSSYFNGLNAPIVGDILYGKADIRLMLHCFSLGFKHPITKDFINVESKQDFKFI